MSGRARSSSAFDAGAATESGKNQKKKGEFVCRITAVHPRPVAKPRETRGQATARDLCDAPRGRTPGGRDARAAGSTREARRGSRGTFPRGRADANPSRGGDASDATATRSRDRVHRERGAKRITRRGSGRGGRADAPLSPHLSVASAAARRHPARRGTARAYSRFSRARDVRCPPWPNPLPSDFNPRPRLAKFRSIRQPDTAPRDVRDRLDRVRVPLRVSSRPCDDARPSRGAFDVCAGLSGARPRVASRSFFNVTDRVCR